jgi:outer membrane receptor for ferrienterochelin and colicins
MFYIKRLSVLIFLLSIALVCTSLILAQEQEKQEVTEEFFYAEEEVEIASLKPTKIEEAPSIVSVITAQQIKDMGARDLNDVLCTVPGFQLPINHRYASKYVVRGVGQQTYINRVLVMLDGIPLNEPYYGQASLNWGDMSLNNVKRIEIIRGPGSALYGTYAFMAVINIITKEAEDINGIELSVGGGSYSTQHHYITAGKKIGDFSLSGHFDFRKSDGYDNYYIKQDLINLLDSYVPFLASASMAPGFVHVPLNSKRADFAVKYKNFDFQFKAQDYDRGLPFPSYSVTEGFKQKDKSYISQAIFAKDINDKLSLMLKGNYLYRKEIVYGQAYPSGIFGPLLPGFGAQGFFTDGIQGELTVEEHSMGVQTRFDYTVTDNNSLTFGIEYANLKTNKPTTLCNMDPITRTQASQYFELSGASFGFIERDADRDVIAAFLQNNWTIAEKINLTAGLRLDHYSEFGSAINPRISLVWKLLKDTNIKILYGHAFRAPTFDELYSVHAASVGNENLGPEKVRSFEIGINHKITPNINTSINYFYNALSDMILQTGKIIIETYPPQLENSGKINSQGFEAEVKANFEKNTYAYFNYSYAKAKDELTNTVVPNVANNLFNFGLNIGSWKYLNAHFNVNYVGQRKRGNQILPLFGIIDPRDPIKAYSISNFTLRAQNFWEHTEILLSIHNLFNTEYTDPEEQGLIYYDFPREGRQVLGKVIFKF